jgi:hypothetical protein
MARRPGRGAMLDRDASQASYGIGADGHLYTWGISPKRQATVITLRRKLLGSPESWRSARAQFGAWATVAGG